MILKNRRILVQYSGGKDSTACLIKMIEAGAYVEAVHFTHRYGYQLPTEEAERICGEKNVKLHLIDVTDEIESLFLNDFSQRPCRFCKGIMDKITVGLAVRGCFDYICVGDTASDRTLVERLRETGETDIMINSYFNKAVALPEKIKIIRPLIEYGNEQVFEFLAGHSVDVKRNNDTGDKYFEYSREGCPLQFKDYGVCYSRQLMENLKTANTLCSEFATNNGIKASIHLPSETIVTIPKGYENACRAFLEEKGFRLKKRYEVRSASGVFFFSVSLYPEICHVNRMEELFSRLLERLSERVKNVVREKNHVMLKSDFIEINCTLVRAENRAVGNIRSVRTIEKDLIESLFVELFHTYDFDIYKSENRSHIRMEPVLLKAANCRYLAGGGYGRRFIRSGSIDGISADDAAELHHQGISAIIDLRNEKQCQKDQISLFSENGMQYVCIPFQGSNPPDARKTNEVKTVAESYLSLVRQYDVMENIFRTIGKAEGGVLIFCKHGKDRTGIVAMILELLCDVPIEVIVKDYSISELYLNHEMYEDKVYEMSADIPVQFINAFHLEYGSALKYLKRIGIKEDEIRKIRSGMGEIENG